MSLSTLSGGVFIDSRERVFIDFLEGDFMDSQGRVFIDFQEGVIMDAPEGFFVVL